MFPEFALYLGDCDNREVPMEIRDEHRSC